MNVLAEAQNMFNQLPTSEHGFMLVNWVERNRSKGKVHTPLLQLQPPKLGLWLLVGGERYNLELGFVRMKMVHRHHLLII